MPTTRSSSTLLSPPATFRAGAAWCLIALYLLTAGVVVAQPPYLSPSAKLVRRGVESRQRGNDKRALTLFRRAYALDGSPVALAQMGEAEHALGRFVEAHEHLQAALLVDDPWIAKNRVLLERSLADTSQKMATAPSGPPQPTAQPPEPTTPQISPVEWARLERAEQTIAQSTAALAGVEGALRRLEATWKERRVASESATHEARASIDLLKLELDHCEKSIVSLDLGAQVIAAEPPTAETRASHSPAGTSATPHP